MPARLVTMGLVVGLMFLIVGIGPGFQGIRPALLAAGVGRDACDFPSHASSSHESCKAQGDLVDEYQALSVTIMNLLIMPVGVLADIFGLREIAWMGIVGWTLVMALKVVAPGGGSMYFFSETAANVFGVFVFFAVLNEYSAGVIICGSNRIAMGLATGGWDAGALTYVLMGFAYFSLSLPLELLFVIYALGVGSLFLVVVSVMFPPPWLQNFFGMSGPEHAAGARPSLRNKMREVAQGMQHAFCEPMFLAWIFIQTITIGYGCFFISAVTEQMRFVGAGSPEVDAYSKTFSVMLPCGALLGPWTGMLLRQGAVLRGMMVMMAVQVGCGIGLWVCAATGAGMDLRMQWGTFIFFVVWRMNSVTLVNTTLPLVIPRAYLNTAIGTIFTVSGIVSTLLQHPLSQAIKDDVKSMWYIHTISCGLIVFAWISWGTIACNCLDPRSGMSAAVAREACQDHEVRQDPEMSLVQNCARTQK